MNLEQIYAHFDTHDKKISIYVKKIDYTLWFKQKPENEKELFENLCRIIVGQQLSGKAATAIFTKFKNSFADSKLTPTSLLAKTDQNLRDTGISWAKVKYVKDLAHNFIAKNIRFDSLTTLADEEVISELIKVKGLGRWSAEMFLMFTLHRYDIFSYGDLGLNKGLSKIYKLASPDKTKIAKIVNKWSPYKTFGSIALWESLETK